MKTVETTRRRHADNLAERARASGDGHAA